MMSVMSAIESHPAERLGPAALAILFERVYEGYSVPLHVDETLLRMMVEIYDEDLSASVVLREAGEPIALALLGVRPPMGWVGGMGVVTSHRRQGLGRKVMNSLIASAKGMGLRELWLEVLEQNTAAHSLYASLGFEQVRMVEVWTFSAPSGGPTPGWTVTEGEQLDGPPGERDPWQRAQATRAHLALRPPGISQLCVRGEGMAGSLTLRTNGDTLSLLDARGGGNCAWWAGAIAQAMLARGAKLLRVLNTEAGGRLASAAKLAQGAREASQHEMRLNLG